MDSRIPRLKPTHDENKCKSVLYVVQQDIHVHYYVIITDVSNPEKRNETPASVV